MAINQPSNHCVNMRRQVFQFRAVEITDCGFVVATTQLL